jgi:hypothetical protein
LQDAVEPSGILPYHTIFSGDHCPCFLDFNADLLFAGSSPPLAPPFRRSPQLFDPRRTTKYKECLHDHLAYHNVIEKCKALQEVALTTQWTDSHKAEYEKLDTIITETMLFAEHSCFEWSVTLIRAVETVRYWRLFVKCFKAIIEMLQSYY